MNRLKMLGFTAIAAAVLMAFGGGGTASATTLEVGEVAQGGAVTLSLSLEPGTSTRLVSSLGETVFTCTSSTIHGATTVFSAARVGGPISTLTFSECSHTVDVLASGIFSIERIGSTTNGTVQLAKSEILVFSTFFGVKVTCKAGEVTDVGTLTGKSGTNSGDRHATLDLNATIDCGVLGNSSWTGSYTVTSPTGLGVIG